MTLGGPRLPSIVAKALTVQLLDVMTYLVSRRLKPLTSVPLVSVLVTSQLIPLSSHIQFVACYISLYLLKRLLLISSSCRYGPRSSFNH